MDDQFTTAELADVAPERFHRLRKPLDAEAYATWDGEPQEVRDVPNPEDLPASELRSA